MHADLRSSRPPLHPRRLARWFWRLILDVVEEYRRDGVGDLAAAITFWTLLSIPAAALALVSMLSSLDSLIGGSLAQDVEDEVIGFVEDTFADSQALEDTVLELFADSSTGVATVATLVAIFTLSRAFAGLIRALDNAYGVDEGRPWWYLRLVAIGLGLTTILIVASGATVLAIIPQLPFGLLRWFTVPIVFVALVLWAATIFHIGPNHRTPWKYDLPGAFVTALGWVLGTQAFALYVSVAGGGNDVQTTVGAILLALTLMYVLSIVMLVGAEVNDVIARRAGVVQERTHVNDRARRVRAWIRRQRERRAAATADADEPTAAPESTESA